MSGNYDNTNSGVLFRNDDKNDSSINRDKSKWPDYKGTLDVEGTEYWLSAWIKTANDGRKFMSLTVRKKEGKSAPMGRRPRNDDEPF